MVLTNILTFLRAAEQGSFSSAAKDLYTSNVSVTKRIRALEEELGVRLFVRTNQGVQLTKAGASFYSDAVLLTKDLESAIEKARKIGKTEERTIRIGSSVMRPHRLVMDQLPETFFHNTDLNIRVVVFSDESTEVYDALEKIGKEYDCLVTTVDGNIERDYSTLLWDQERYRVAMSRRHRLAAKSSLTWEDLEGERLILLKEGIYSVVDRLREEIRTEHPGIHVVDVPHNYTIETINDFVDSDCLMGIINIWSGVHPAIITKPVEWDIYSRYGIVYAKEPERHVKEFIESIRPYAPILAYR